MTCYSRALRRPINCLKYQRLLVKTQPIKHRVEASIETNVCILHDLKAKPIKQLGH